MSLNAIPLRVMPSVDPALAFSAERMFAVYDGGREISYTPFFAQNVNNGNIHVDFNPPDQQTAIHPQFYTNIGYSASFTGVGAGATDPLLTPGVWDAPRAFPMQATTSTADIKINGTAVTSNVQEYFHQLMRVGNKVNNFDLDFSTCPSMLDQYQEYADWVTYGSARNPMALYGENPVQQSRGAFLDPATGGANYLTNTHTAATVVFNSIEPVMISPFYHSKSSFFAKTFNGTWTFSDLKRVWSHGTGPGSNPSGVISSLAVNITSFVVYLRFISAKELSKIPRNVTYDFHEILPLGTTLNVSVAAGASAQIPMNSVNLDAIPKRLLICVRRQDADLLTGANNYLYSDTCARIDQITINWANNQGKLSSCPISQLYQIYRNNGGNESYIQWIKHTGSVLPLDLGRDIGLDSCINYIIQLFTLSELVGTRQAC